MKHTHKILYNNKIKEKINNLESSIMNTINPKHLTKTFLGHSSVGNVLGHLSAIEVNNVAIIHKG